MDLFGKPLIGEDLLLFENLLSEADFQIYDRVFVDDTALWTAIVKEKLLVIYFQGFTSLYIAHEPAEEVGIQIGLSDVLLSLSLE
jgi:hypothetical protein